MGFTLTENMIRTYQDGIDSIIDNLGKSILIINAPKEIVCPNCYWDAKAQRSSGRYNSNNPNTLNGPLHQPFVSGQRCPICKGVGKLKNQSNNTEIEATIKWNPKEDIVDSDGSRIAIPDGVCKIKTYSTNYKKIKNAKSFQVAFDEPAEGSPNYVSCELFRQPTPRGLKYNRYMIAYLKIKQ